MDDNLEKILKDTEDKARKELSTNPGHVALFRDVAHLQESVVKCEYHDFLSELAAPKVALVQTLEEMIEAVKTGKYDN